MEGDKVFVEFLIDEIKEEKKIQKYKFFFKMFGDWELEVNGMEVKLLCKVVGEKIMVIFNINNSIFLIFDGEEEFLQGQKVEEQELELILIFNFVVEVIKIDGKKIFVLDCYYFEDEIGYEDEVESDIFFIKEVSFQVIGDFEWRDINYIFNIDFLDWVLYDYLMDFFVD